MENKLNELINKLIEEINKSGNGDVDALLLMSVIEKYKNMDNTERKELLGVIENFATGHPQVTEIINEIVVLLNEAGL